MRELKNGTFLGLLFLLIACNSISGEKQQERPDKLISNSISNQFVTSFAEDALGHIWMSTIRGLNKYNVYEYHQYFSTTDSSSLSDNRIQNLYRDSKNRLWATTVNGVCRYTDTDCFERVPIESTSQNGIYFFENNQGKLFLSMNFQICAYNEEQNRFELVIDGLGNVRGLTYCKVDKMNRMWIVTPTDVWCYDSETYKLIETFKPFGYITFSHLTADGELWLASWAQLRIYNTITQKYVDVPQVISNHPILSKAIITKFHVYNNTSVLLNTQKDGLFLYNHILGTVVHQSESGFPFEAPKAEITSLFTDSRKNLWIGTYDQGFTVRYNYKERFNSNNYLRAQLKHLSVVHVAPDPENNIWISTQNDGLKIFNIKNEEFYNVSTDHLFPHKNELFKHKVKRILIDKDKSIWLLSDWVLLHCSFRNRELSLLKSYYIPTGILSIAQDRKGTIWLGGMNESIYNKRMNEDTFSLFPLYGKEYNFTTCLLPTSDGKLLVASFGHNLQQIDPETWETSTIEILDLIKNSKFIPTSLFEDRDGTIWIGTITNGLFRYSPKKGEMQCIAGITCSDISAISEDALGNIWISTLYGMSQYDPKNETIINYYETDGIGGNQFNEQSVCSLPDHSLIFGGTHGITFFNPVDVPYKRTVPLLFENLKIHNQSVHPARSKSIDKHLAFNPNIKLKHNQSSFAISFAAIEYGEYERVRYFYMLEGFDKFWIDAHNNREAYYSNLPAGKYKFKVKITNYENTVIEAENELKVKRLAAPWFSWPAIIFYLIGFELILVLIVRTQKRIKADKEKALLAEREKEQEQRVNKMNMSFFANISHEFRTPLTMISGPVSILSKDETMSADNKQLLFIVQRNVNRMLRLINQLMDFNKLENDALKLQVKPTDLIAELKRMVETYSINIREKGIELVTYGLEDSFVMWLDSDKLEKITANLITNALKFSSPGGKIQLQFDVISAIEAAQIFKSNKLSHHTQFAKISIADTGLGIPEDKLEKIFERYYQLDNQTREFYNWGTGIGLYYSRCLAELHHGAIKADNRPQGGAIFTFVLPISEQVYTEDERSGEFDTLSVSYPTEAPLNYDLAEGNQDQSPLQTLLLIDDDTEVIHYLKSLLLNKYNIHYRFDADSAFKDLADIEPDLVLCDVVMPGSNGFEFCKKVKESPSFCHIPVVLVTAKATVENQVEGLNTGADAYVTKPFDPSYLLALINSQLKNREKVRNLLATATKTEAIDENILSPQDTAFMSNLYSLMENELSNTELNITRMTEVLKISRTKFYYKVKGLTGENPNVFFKTYKLNRAAEFLLEGKYNVSEIADMTGFSTLSHFSVSFKKQFGVAPAKYGINNG